MVLPSVIILSHPDPIVPVLDRLPFFIDNFRELALSMKLFFVRVDDVMLLYPGNSLAGVIIRIMISTLYNKTFRPSPKIGLSFLVFVVIQIDHKLQSGVSIFFDLPFFFSELFSPIQRSGDIGIADDFFGINPLAGNGGGKGK
jgi:hypothetical protein